MKTNFHFVLFYFIKIIKMYYLVNVIKFDYSLMIMKSWMTSTIPTSS